MHFVGPDNVEYLDISSNEFIFSINSNWVPPPKLDSISMNGNWIGPSFPIWVQKLENLIDIPMANIEISDAMLVGVGISI